ncbi:uncharacterized protein B0H18DRAFT_1094040 [Fomitopsis serialis]|uniref:uncharacterized protein n=1 Tax=Fomitopsis serialis TaxID=139415 RepID=UPI0020083CB0|nr:uncharacterized protein B0H18DRAFT_1094040 [Neoantrodia serialis]KAH9928806.1 hypothetical protein B0H18DRAFT_1094040 [Neoantrodia serialis]
MERISMLSTLTLAGDAIPKPIILSRRLDFPSRQRDYDLGEYISRPDWRPSPLPKDGHLSLYLEECIAGGRSAVVYAAEISTAYEAGTIPLSNPHPLEQEFCVKIARRNRCRTLAREAWVSEQLRSRGQLQGVIAPRFYGFFTASLSDDQSVFPLWDTDDFRLEISDDDPTRDDPLPDDEPLEEEYDNGPGVENARHGATGSPIQTRRSWLSLSCHEEERPTRVRTTRTKPIRKTSVRYWMTCHASTSGTGIFARTTSFVRLREQRCVKGISVCTSGTSSISPGLALTTQTATLTRNRSAYAGCSEHPIAATFSGMVLSHEWRCAHSERDTMGHWQRVATRSINL